MSKKSSVGSSGGFKGAQAPLRRGFLRGDSLLRRASLMARRNLGGYFKGVSPLNGNALARRSLLPISKKPLNVNHLRKSAPARVERPGNRSLLEHIKICKDRNERREVLFALRQTGSNSSHKTKVYTEKSKVRC
ncbi:hypothetical protein [Peromfec virus RodF5_12]|uniref:Uncharacterized protein n=1 Tax=Peromfec virus RodF5_12 TaxID=2929336 RepID=A0A976N249_9VIRU|nr:hypothetical protein [Peromfec virus RodF5_12]